MIMDALKQYIELYNEVRDRLGDGLADRERALKALEGFAGVKDGEADELFGPDYGVNVDRVRFGADLAATFRCGVPNISTLLGLVVNDSFAATDTLRNQLPEGVTVCSLRDAPADIRGKYLDGLAGCRTAAAALNSLLLQDGVLVHVAAGVRLERPVQLVNLFTAPMPMLCTRRIVFVAEDNSSARLIVCDHSQRTDTAMLANEVVEIYCGEGASAEFYTIDETSPQAKRCRSLFVRQATASQLHTATLVLSCGVAVDSWDIDACGDHTDTEMAGLVIGDGLQQTSTHVHLTHRGTDGRSRQLFKYALDGESRGTFDGRIVVAHGAVRTDALQTNRNLLSGDKSRMTAAPQLEIYCDDVRCSHGATTGQLDAAALFYMQTRGIPEQEARQMLTQAFMTDVIDTVTYPLVRDRLRALVERRLGGHGAYCADCHRNDGQCDDNDA